MQNQTNRNIGDILQEEHKQAIDDLINDEFKTRSYRERMYNNMKISKEITSLFHILSGFTATIGLSTILALMLGIDLNLSSLVHNPTLSNLAPKILIILGCGFIFYKLELLKGDLISQYKKSKLKGDYIDKSSKNLALVFSLVNITLSLIGAYMVTSAVLNIKGQDAMNAVYAEHEPIIQKLEEEHAANLQSYKDDLTALNGDEHKVKENGKMVFRWGHGAKIAQQQKALNEANAKGTATIEAARSAFETAKAEVRAVHGLQAGTITNSDKNTMIIAGMGIFQIILELGIFFLKGFQAKYLYTSYLEKQNEEPLTDANIQNNKPLDLTGKGAYSGTGIQIQPQQMNNVKKPPLQMKKIPVANRQGQMINMPPSKAYQTAMQTNDIDKLKDIMKAYHQAMS